MTGARARGRLDMLVIAETTLEEQGGSYAGTVAELEAYRAGMRAVVAALRAQIGDRCTADELDPDDEPSGEF